MGGISSSRWLYELMGIIGELRGEGTGDMSMIGLESDTRRGESLFRAVPHMSQNLV
jgi:hypothetical protein